MLGKVAIAIVLAIAIFAFVRTVSLDTRVTNCERKTGLRT
jgi:hypothetical protein